MRNLVDQDVLLSPAIYVISAIGHCWVKTDVGQTYVTRQMSSDCLLSVSFS